MKVAKQWKASRSKTARTAVRTIVGAMAAPEIPTETLMKLFWKSVGKWVKQVRQIRKKLMTVKLFTCFSKTGQAKRVVRSCAWVCR